MNEEEPQASQLPPLTTEQVLIDALPELHEKLPITAGLVISTGRAQSARFMAEQLQVARVEAWFYDLHAATQSRAALDATAQVHCSADLPESSYDAVLVAVLKKTETELTRDILQQAHGRLSEGGRLIVSVDNPKDHWLNEQLQGMFNKVTRIQSEQGCVYVGRKTGELKKVKDFWCEFPFRDENGRMHQVLSRPGVFSHRRLDAGARQLMRSAEISPTDNVLDLGCGAGTLSLAAATETTGTVYAVDANARAIQCVQKAAELNGIQNIEAILNADGQLGLNDKIDLVLANPPYFGNDTISKHFVDTSRFALRSGGALLVVTKKPRWYSEYFEGRFEDPVVFESGKYFVACGRKP